MARQWTCQKCKRVNARTKQKCPCGRKRPVRAVAAHKKVLEVPYEVWVSVFGERCGICGKPPQGRRLDRDHDHKTGSWRGLLCHRCNRALPGHITAEWCEAAAKYLRAAATHPPPDLDKE